MHNCPDRKYSNWKWQDWKRQDWKWQDWKCCDWQNGMALLGHRRFHCVKSKTNMLASEIVHKWYIGSSGYTSIMYKSKSVSTYGCFDKILSYVRTYLAISYRICVRTYVRTYCCWWSSKLHHPKLRSLMPRLFVGARLWSRFSCDTRGCHSLVRTQAYSQSEQTGCIAATKLVWTAVILNDIEASGPLTNGRALKMVEHLKW